ncbi:hypothetical protein [Streptomyces sp. NPDC056948]|uniref:hypothetical protein n=1 Tax=Streptomyces sp. NPDC056948 TaxID=3345975 RepID=UPI0036259847
MRRWYGTSDLAKHTAVLAALVAAVSLAISAWGTYKAAQVADDQLAQSRDQQEIEEAAQASRVGMWAAYANIVIANRSLDPVHAYIETDGRTAQDKPRYVNIGIVPPCVEFSIPAEKVTLAPGGDSDGPWLKVRGLVFTDARGKWWKRNPNGTLEASAPRPDLPDYLSLKGSLVKDKVVTPKDLELCGTHP